MAEFLQIGNHWLNLEALADVHLTRDVADPNQIVMARVIFTGGLGLTFTEPAEIRALLAWLQAHKSP